MEATVAEGIGSSGHSLAKKAFTFVTGKECCWLSDPPFAMEKIAAAIKEMVAPWDLDDNGLDLGKSLNETGNENVAKREGPRKCNVWKEPKLTTPLNIRDRIREYTNVSSSKDVGRMMSVDAILRWCDEITVIVGTDNITDREPKACPQLIQRCDGKGWRVVCLAMLRLTLVLAALIEKGEKKQFHAFWTLIQRTAVDISKPRFSREVNAHQKKVPSPIGLASHWLGILLYAGQMCWMVECGGKKKYAKRKALFTTRHVRQAICWLAKRKRPKEGKAVAGRRRDLADSVVAWVATQIDAVVKPEDGVLDEGCVYLWAGVRSECLGYARMVRGRPSKYTRRLVGPWCRRWGHFCEIQQGVEKSKLCWLRKHFTGVEPGMNSIIVLFEAE